MSNVNKMMFLLLISALFLAFPAMAAEQVNGKTFYTTANIWYEEPDQIESTNYHIGAILPVGTKVKITEVSDGTDLGLSGYVGCGNVGLFYSVYGRERATL